MFKASDDENPEQSSAECDHCAGIPQQSWGRLCPWRRGGHRQQQGRHRGGGGGLAGHVDQRLLGDGHQGQEVTQVLQAPDHPHLQVGIPSFRESVHYINLVVGQFSPPTITVHLLTPHSMSDKRKYSQPGQTWRRNLFIQNITQFIHTARSIFTDSQYRKTNQEKLAKI